MPESVFARHSFPQQMQCLEKKNSQDYKGSSLSRLARRSAKYITKLIFQAPVPSSEEWDLNPW